MSPPGVTPQLLPQPTPRQVPRLQTPEGGYDPNRPLTGHGPQVMAMSMPPGTQPIPYGNDALTPTSAPQTTATATPPGPSTVGNIGQQLTDPTPYTSAVSQGQGLLSTIPTNAGFLGGSSPMFRGMNMGRLNQQVGQFGGDLRNQANLEFSRKAGTEVPRMLLAQLAGLRGLENDTLGLENTLLQNQVQASLVPIQTIMRLLGAVGGFF